VSWNAKPQRPLGYYEEVKAKLLGCLLLDTAGKPRSCESSESARGQIYKPKEKARQGSRKSQEKPRMENQMN
jgi:hypothetical protein